MGVKPCSSEQRQKNGVGSRHCRDQASPRRRRSCDCSATSLEHSAVRRYNGGEELQTGSCSLRLTPTREANPRKTPSPRKKTAFETSLEPRELRPVRRHPNSNRSWILAGARRERQSSACVFQNTEVVRGLDKTNTRLMTLESRLFMHFSNCNSKNIHQRLKQGTSHSKWELFI